MIPPWLDLLTDPNFALDEVKTSVPPQRVMPQFPKLMSRRSPKALSMERPSWISRWREVQRPQPLWSRPQHQSVQLQEVTQARKHQTTRWPSRTLVATRRGPRNVWYVKGRGIEANRAGPAPHARASCAGEVSVLSRWCWLTKTCAKLSGSSLWKQSPLTILMIATRKSRSTRSKNSSKISSVSSECPNDTFYMAWCFLRVGSQAEPERHSLQWTRFGECCGRQTEENDRAAARSNRTILHWIIQACLLVHPCNSLPLRFSVWGCLSTSVLSTRFYADKGVLQNIVGNRSNRYFWGWICYRAHAWNLNPSFESS